MKVGRGGGVLRNRAEQSGLDPFHMIARFDFAILMQVATEERFVTPCVAGRAMVVLDDEGEIELTLVGYCSGM